MVVEFAREILNDEEANSAEFDQGTKNPVIDLLPEQREINDMAVPCVLGCIHVSLPQVRSLPKRMEPTRYRNGIVIVLNSTMYIANNSKRADAFSGLSPDGRLVEIAELTDHPFMVGTQFHPEFLSRPNRPHPLFVAFVKAICEHSGVLTIKNNAYHFYLV